MDEKFVERDIEIAMERPNSRDVLKGAQPKKSANSERKETPKKYPKPECKDLRHRNIKAVDAREGIAGKEVLNRLSVGLIKSANSTKKKAEK